MILGVAVICIKYGSKLILLLVDNVGFKIIVTKVGNITELTATWYTLTQNAHF